MMIVNLHAIDSSASQDKEEMMKMQEILGKLLVSSISKFKKKMTRKLKTKIINNPENEDSDKLYP